MSVALKPNTLCPLSIAKINLKQFKDMFLFNLKMRRGWFSEESPLGFEPSPAKKLKTNTKFE
jgi:hypothetical protein